MKKQICRCTGLAAALLLALSACASGPKVDLTGVTSYYVKEICMAEFFAN